MVLATIGYNVCISVLAEYAPVDYQPNEIRYFVL